MTDGLAKKGVLRPDASMATVDRRELGGRFADLARQVWIPRWHLPVGQSLDQPILQYPAVNVAVESGEARAYLPVDGVGHRELTGTGWAAGVLLRPGAGTLVVPGDHSELLGTVWPITDGETLVAAVETAMADDADFPGVVAAYEEWLAPLLDVVDDEVRLVNAICDAAESDPQVTAPRDLLDRFDLNERTMQRLLKRRVGFSPRWLIQRRRLQEAAYRIREEPDVSLADLAADLGYADQAHFTRDFGNVIGQPPGDYRRSLGIL